MHFVFENGYVEFYRGFKLFNYFGVFKKPFTYLKCSFHVTLQISLGCICIHCFLKNK